MALSTKFPISANAILYCKPVTSVPCFGQISPQKLMKPALLPPSVECRGRVWRRESGEGIRMVVAIMASTVSPQKQACIFQINFTSSSRIFVEHITLGCVWARPRHVAIWVVIKFNRQFIQFTERCHGREGQRRAWWEITSQWSIHLEKNGIAGCSWCEGNLHQLWLSCSIVREGEGEGAYGSFY